MTNTQRCGTEMLIQIRDHVSRKVWLVITTLSLLLATQFWFGKHLSMNGGQEQNYDRASCSDNVEEFYNGYQKLECISCAEADQLENPKAPLFFVIGAQKSGTSNLMNRMLPAHPAVFVRGKFVELHLLDTRWKKSYGGKPTVNRCAILRSYNQLLAGSKVTGAGFVDKSPSYISNSDIVPQRMLCAYPNAKMILLLRNPVSRCYSHYHHSLNVREAHDRSGSFEDNLNYYIAQAERSNLLQTNLTAQQEYELWTNKPKEMNFNYVSRGLYAVQIRQWMAVLGDHFGWDKIWDHLLILEAEEVWKDEQGHLDRILEFVGLPPFQFPEENAVQKKRYSRPMRNDTRERLEELYRPHNQKLHRLLSPHGINISWAAAA